MDEHERSETHQLVLSLEHDSDLIAVLRGHLYIEAALTRLIAAQYPGSDDLVMELSYMHKIRLARRRNLIDKAFATALQTLGNVRDSFAHLPIKLALTPEDDEAMKVAVLNSVFLNRGYERFIEGEHGAGKPTRSAIMAIYVILHATTVPFEQWVYPPGVARPNLYED